MKKKMTLYFGLKMTKLKPIDTDVHFIYRCPNCGLEHWASLVEVNTPKFIIVCDCKNILRPKPIVDIKINYKKPSKKYKKEEIDIDKLRHAARILIDYGFDMSEAESLIKKAYSKSEDHSVSHLVKLALTIFGESNVK